MAQLIVIVALFALLWLFLIAPQRRRLQEQRKLIESVEVGDEILTVGGIIGVVRAEHDEELLVEIAPGTEVRVSRRAVAAVLPPEDESEEEVLEDEVEEEPASLEAGNREPNEEIRS